MWQGRVWKVDFLHDLTYTFFNNYFQLLYTPKVPEAYLIPPQAFRIDMEKNDYSHHKGELVFVSSDGKPVDFYSIYLENYPGLKNIVEGLVSREFFSKFSHACLNIIRRFLHYGRLEDMFNIIHIEEVLNFEKYCPDNLLKCQLEVLLLRAVIHKDITLMDGITFAKNYNLENLLWKLRGFLMR